MKKLFICLTFFAIAFASQAQVAKQPSIPVDSLGIIITGMQKQIATLSLRNDSLQKTINGFPTAAITFEPTQFLQKDTLIAGVTVKKYSLATLSSSVITQASLDAAAALKAANKALALKAVSTSITTTTTNLQ